MSLGTAQDMHTVTPGEGLSAALRQGFPNPQSYVPSPMSPCEGPPAATLPRSQLSRSSALPCSRTFDSVLCTWFLFIYLFIFNFILILNFT